MVFGIRSSVASLNVSKSVENGPDSQIQRHADYRDCWPSVQKRKKARHFWPDPVGEKLLQSLRSGKHTCRIVAQPGREGVGGSVADENAVSNEYTIADKDAVAHKNAVDIYRREDSSHRV